MTLFRRVLNGERHLPPPLWMMRQAGRYLPEYRETRAQAGSFLKLCYTPELACEVTLQPIRRFHFDASILFSDILVVPHALGQNFWLEEGEGPRLDPISEIGALGAYDQDAFLAHLEPVFDAVSMIREALPEDVDLIGFCGAPWTVASYMIAGRGTPDLAPARALAAERPEAMDAIINRLVEASADYLIRQVERGVQALQIFESWAQVLEGEAFDRWSYAPAMAIVRKVKAVHPDIPIIVFPRKSGHGYEKMAREPLISAVSLDSDIDLDYVRRSVQPHAAVQGNIPPEAMIAGPDAIDRAVEKAAEALGNGPWIANLGHGIDKSTPVAHVEHLVKRVRALG